MAEPRKPENNERFASVWDAIESTPALAANMRLRSSLMIALKDHITREGLSQSQAAKVFDVTQPRVSDLMRGKIELFGGFGRRLPSTPLEGTPRKGNF
jgi:predicted XRE-type DNA-binding protein